MPLWRTASDIDIQRGESTNFGYCKGYNFWISDIKDAEVPARESGGTTGSFKFLSKASCVFNIKRVLGIPTQNMLLPFL